MTDENSKKPYKRRCANWLLTFREWTLPRSEAKESFIFWTALFTLASAIRRKVYIPKTVLGSWEVAPYLYIMFVAPAGKARKTTTLSYSDDLLLSELGIKKASASMTVQVLMKRLADSPDNSLSIQIKEFGTFYNQSKEMMIDFLTALFDGVKRHDSDTLSRGVEFAERPCINLIAATTPKWIAENLSENAVGGGFASRVIFIFEDTVRRRRLFYHRGKDKVDPEKMKELHGNLLMDLVHISQNIEGEFKLTDEAEAYAEDWYIKYADNPSVPDPRLTGYNERKPAYMFKLAMLCHLAYSDELLVNKGDVQQALALLKNVEGKMLQTFQAIGKNPHTLDLETIVEYVNEIGEVAPAKLRKNFQHVATPRMLDELLMFLVTTRQITEVNTNGIITIKPGRKK
jgi:hypothetical protein